MADFSVLTTVITSSADIGIIYAKLKIIFRPSCFSLGCKTVRTTDLDNAAESHREFLKLLEHF